MKRNLGFLAMLALSSFAGVLASAQSAPPPMSGQQSYPADQSYPQADQQQSGPAQGVARVSLLRGDVSTQRGDSGDWVAVTLNTPVMAGDKVSTSAAGSAELELDSTNMLRLSGHTEADITTLVENRIQIQLAQGLAQYSVLRGSEADVEIDTPNVGIHPSGDTSVRVQVNSENETVVIVRRGEAEIFTSQGSTRVGAGQMITIRGTTDDAQYQTANAPGLDEWDTWNDGRDGNIQSSPAWNHVDPAYTGANDLDRNGEWSEVPDYGQVWTPNNEDPDWAPYSDGNWVWEPYYGWTWVGNEQWGWAPYHYGRWFRYGGAWRWWPGERGVSPVWAPAYVSFFGFDGDFGIDDGFGSIGWLPIGPCDPFFPWYGGFGFRVGFFGFRDFNRFDFRDRGDLHRRFPGAFEPLRHGRFDERFSNFRQAERDPHILRGVNSVRASEFGHGAVGHTRGISSQQFQNSHFTSGRVPAVPTHASLSATNRTPNPGTIRNNQNTRFFGNGSRQPAQHNSFNEQAGRVQQSLRGNGAVNGGVNNGPESNIRRYGSQPGRPTPGNGSSGSVMRQNNTNVPNRGASAPTQTGRPGTRSFEGQGTERPNTPAPTNGGWQRFNGPANPPVQRQPEQQMQPGRISNPINVDRPTTPSQPRYQGNSRPPLDLRRPVVGGAPNGRPIYGGGYPGPARPTYNGNPQSGRPSYGPPPQPVRPPSFGGGYPAPSRPSYGGNPAPSRPSYSPPASRPSYGGGRPAPSAPSRSSGGSSGGSHGGSSGGSSHGSSGGSGRHH